jgi:hypothetical protein
MSKTSDISKHSKYSNFSQQSKSENQNELSVDDLKEIMNIYQMQGKDTRDIEQKLARFTMQNHNYSQNFSRSSHLLENTTSVYFEKGSSMTFEEQTSFNEP